MSDQLNLNVDLSQLTAFGGLTDNQIISLCRVGTIKKVGIGKAIALQCSSDPTMFVVLKGSASLFRNISGRTRQVAVLRQGDLLPDAGGGTKIQSVSAAALEPMTLLELNYKNLESLDSKTQLAFLKNLTEISLRRMNEFMLTQARCVDQHAQLSSYLTKSFWAKEDPYKGCEMIQSLLEGIPSLPMYASRLAALLQNENASIRDVADLAKVDPSLVGVVLKTVNSPFYGFSGKISDFQRAVLLLGFGQVYQLVMGLGVQNTMPRTPEFVALHMHSMIVSFLAAEVAQIFRLPSALAVGTTGLLHDIGQSVVLLLKRRHPKMQLMVDLLDSAKLGAMLLEKWNIPAKVCGTVECLKWPSLLPPEGIPQDNRTEVAVIYVAHLCYEYLAGAKERDLPTAFMDEYLDLLKSPSGSIVELVADTLWPVLQKKLNVFPEEVRRFFIEGGRRLKKMPTKTRG